MVATEKPLRELFISIMIVNPKILLVWIIMLGYLIHRGYITYISLCMVFVS